ncbi:hypothetical protein H4582DRAFT_1821124 [Lactarius indigo]|nr:hypothetical protein H4582DRAFT_1821124 [Lactarius indigo]
MRSSLCSTNGEFSVLRASRRDAEKWLKERMIMLSEKSASLEHVVNVISKVGQSYPSSAPPPHIAGDSHLCDMVATALSYSTIFDIDTLFKLDAVLTAQA